MRDLAEIKRVNRAKNVGDKLGAENGNSSRRPVLLDEARTARLLMRSSGRRVCPLYARERAQQDMVLERAIVTHCRGICRV